MAIVVSGTSTAQGELVVGNIVHNAAVNCMIVPADAPDDWYFKQFTSMDEVNRYAEEYGLIVKLPQEKQS